MKIRFLLLLLCVTASQSLRAQYDYQNINFLGRFYDSTVVAESVYGIKYQSCWGWADTVSGREYGIIGSTAGTYIVDVTDPANPVQRDYIPHRQNDCIWHEYKTYGKYLYIISDDSGPNSLQIADLSYLPDSVDVVYDSTDIFERGHTLYIDGDKLYVASVKTTTGSSSMDVYSLANPLHPALLRSLNQDYPLISAVHDMFVVNDTVYASCGYDGLFIFRYDEGSNVFVLLGSLQDASNIYNHSSFVSSDRSTLYMCEEVPDGRPVKVVDISNISNPFLVDTFYSNAGATPHNPYVVGNLLFVAYYQDGVYIYDITNPFLPVRLGYFDTYPANPVGTYLWPPYAGAWAAYTDLPSGVLLVSDMQSGLFCLDISGITGVSVIAGDPITVFPNPASHRVTVKGAGNSEIQLIDVAGRICLTENSTATNFSFDVSGLAKGVYILRMSDNKRIFSAKVIID
jgi:choice-of-anchor B domain-containing protein